jgi:hypothetical protein
MLGSCGDTAETEDSRSPTYEHQSTSDRTGVGTAGQFNEPPASIKPSVPLHNYDAQDGNYYSYFAAISENDRKAGKSANDVVTYAYLGIRDGKHILATLRPNGTILHEARCATPCKVITFSDGQQVAYNTASVIGGAFEDAIAGRLQTSSYTTTKTEFRAKVEVKPEPEYTTPEDGNIGSLQEPNAASWNQAEAEQIELWKEANNECRGGTDPQKVEDACANRDNVYGPAIAEFGICYGHGDEPASESKFHTCEQDSISLR